MGRQKTTTEFISDAIKIHDNVYDYSLVDYIKAIIKVTIKCSIHGEFEQTPNSHLNGRGCPKCGTNRTANIQRKTLPIFIQESKNVHGDRYDYTLVDYIHAHSKVSIVCPDHGVFNKTPRHHLNGQGCPKCTLIRVGDLFRNDDQEYCNNFILYRNVVDSITRKSYLTHKNIINPLDLPRGKGLYHLDHIYSASVGFNENIPPYIIGSYINLQMLSEYKNISKHSKCGITKGELYKRYITIC